jgi:hypothetical protein
MSIDTDTRSEIDEAHEHGSVGYPCWFECVPNPLDSVFLLHFEEQLAVRLVVVGEHSSGSASTAGDASSNRGGRRDYASAEMAA